MSHGYVLRNKEGLFLVYHENTTHTGTHRTIKWTDDLNQASVLCGLLPYQVRRDLPEGLDRLDVRVERRVFLLVEPQPH